MSSRSIPRKRKIIAIDSETDQDGRILLLLASDAEGHARYLHDPDGLSLDQCIEFLFNQSGNLCIGYVFEYDTVQMLKHLPAEHLDQLRHTGRVIWKRWRIRHIPRKRLSVTDRISGRSTTVWDVAGWTQCSFVRLIEDWQIGTTAERQYVAEMKARRQDWSSTSTADLVRYTTLECQLLAQWFARLLTLHQSVGLSLRSYCGGGSTAAAFLRRHGWRPPEVPPEVQQIAEQAFFGGRAEISRIGEISGTIYGYDIQSAYPAQIAALPEIANARWHRTDRWIDGAWGFYSVRWHQPEHSAWGLFPMRGARLPFGRRSVSLLYPICGTGWYHSLEVAAALEVAPESIEVLEGIVIDPAGRPFEWIAKAAAERLQHKAAGRAEATVLKYALNSCYGKLAQHTGSHPYQCLTYAAAITAGTRARLLRACYHASHDVLLLATDGILSTRPLDLPISPKLGDWEATTYQGAFLIQSGVYWVGDKMRSRGIDARSLDLESARAEWRRNRLRGELTVTVRRVLSYRIACARGKPHLAGQWETHERSIRFDPAPRRRPWKSAGSSVLTLPAHVADYQIQAALDEAWLQSDHTSCYDDLECMPDWEYD